jgi:hypothetical protein
MSAVPPILFFERGMNKQTAPALALLRSSQSSETMHRIIMPDVSQILRTQPQGQSKATVSRSSCALPPPKYYALDAVGAKKPDASQPASML